MREFAIGFSRWWQAAKQFLASRLQPGFSSRLQPGARSLVCRSHPLSAPLAGTAPGLFCAAYARAVQLGVWVDAVWLSRIKGRSARLKVAFVVRYIGGPLNGIELRDDSSVAVECQTAEIWRTIERGKRPRDPTPYESEHFLEFLKCLGRAVCSRNHLPSYVYLAGDRSVVGDDEVLCAVHVRRKDFPPEHWVRRTGVPEIDPPRWPT